MRWRRKSLSKKIFLTLACLAILSYSKVVETRHRLPPLCKESDYGTKFGVKENHTIRATIRMHIHNPHNWIPDIRTHEPGETVKVQAGIFDDDAWDRIQHISDPRTCRNPNDPDFERPLCYARRS